MKRASLAAYIAFILLMLVTSLFYISLYRNQIEYSNKLLDRQVMIAGSDIDNTSMYIISDLTEIGFSDDITLFFADPGVNERVREKMKLYYSKYSDIIVGLMFYNTNGDVYTLFKDEERNSWLDGSYRAQTVPTMHTMDKLEPDRDRYKYYLPVLHEGEVLGNLVITIDFRRYFSGIFAKYNLEKYQWQWVISDSGTIIFDNGGDKRSYTNVDRITRALEQGNSGRLTHAMRTEGENGKREEILSSYYPVNILGLDFSLVFSAYMEFFQKYIVRNSVILGLLTMLTILFIILLFRRFSRKQSKALEMKTTSEAGLLSIIDRMPVGFIIHNKGMEILRANRQAAGLFAFEDETAITGKLMPDLSGNKYAMDIAGKLGEGKVIRLPSPGGEKIIFLNTVPVTYNGEECTLEALIDITSLELARRHEADANIAKSELLARMSFEIRTPLNGILGMTEMLNRSDLPEESKEVARLLRRSAELLLTIINDIFDVSKVETGKMILDEIPFRLRDEVAYCINMIRRRNPEIPVKIESEIEQAVPENIIGDPYRLRQVIINLMTNSVAGTQSGLIKLSCRVRKSEGNSFMLEFTLTDSGNTYTRAEIKRLFGDYITTISERSDWAEDLKLGPVLARQLTELMGGELTAESPAMKDTSGQEKGLRVTFTIKVHLNEKISKNIDLGMYADANDIRTLVITGQQGRDDDFLSVMHRVGLPVSVTSFQKHTASQIRSGLNSGTGRNILLVLFDEPENDGFEAAKVLMDEGLTSEHIVLMFTSRDPKGHWARCVDLGIDHLLVKPFAPEDLMNVLREHFPSLKKPVARLDSDKTDIPVVLVVDDNYLNRKVVGSLLRVLGVSAEYASGGAEAIDMAGEKSYDLILMDLIMPETDGFEATRIILGKNPSTQIIALSADNMPETRLNVEKSGMKELLAKPVTVEELRRVIDRYHKPS
ncbi:MAG: response regulator [Bacteroidales bacterium]|nr:response regulator [Bacteroidales bacterium]